MVFDILPLFNPTDEQAMDFNYARHARSPLVMLTSMIGPLSIDESTSIAASPNLHPYPNPKNDPS